MIEIKIPDAVEARRRINEPLVAQQLKAVADAIEKAVSEQKSEANVPLILLTEVESLLKKKGYKISAVEKSTGISW